MLFFLLSQLIPPFPSLSLSISLTPFPFSCVSLSLALSLSHISHTCAIFSSVPQCLAPYFCCLVRDEETYGSR